MISNKILKSPNKYLYYTFIINTTTLILLIILPHKNIPIYLKITYTLNFNTIIFTQQTIFFTPINKTKITKNKTNTTITLNNFINYTPTMFYFNLYNYILNLNPKIINYKIIFNIITYFTFYNTMISIILIKHINQHKKKILTTKT